MIDLVGLAGSAFVVGSLTMGSFYRLRVMGLAGAAVYIVYGFLLGAWPVVATNTVTLSIHIFHLWMLVVGRTGSAEHVRAATTGPAPVGQVTNVTPPRPHRS